MTYYVKEIVQAQEEATKYYELFKTEIVKDINDNDIEVKKSIGKFTTERLEREKANLQEKIAEIDVKINTINSINN